VTPLLCALFFLSGMAALLFETLWFRQAGLAFGNGVWASSLVLSSFMAGLALGNGLAARFGARLAAPLRAYAALEIAIAVTGVGLVLRLAALTPWLMPVLQPLLDSAWLQNGVRLSAGFLLLLVPATAMGATLPLMVRALRARDPSFGGALGLLYGWNTLGAVLGATLGELWLLERLGVYGTALAAAGCNLSAAGGALWIGSRLDRPPVPTPAAAERWPGGRALLPLAASFVAGGILLALEVVWFRFLHLFVHSGSTAFACMLAIVLTGIGLGGLAAGAWLRRRPEAWRMAPLVALASGVATIALYAAFGRSSALVSGSDHASPVVIAWVTTVIAFPVVLLSGALFPLLGASLSRSLASETATAGWLTLANTVGSALGSLLAGFVLLPMLGMERSLFGLAAAYGIVAGLAAAAGGQRWRSPARIAGVVAFGLALWLFPTGRMDDYLRSPVLHWHAGHEHAVVALREGRTETAVIVERRHAGERLNAFLLTDSFAMSATSTLARRYMKLYVYWPVALRPDPKSALLISYGVGSTAKALVDTRSLETIDVVDISREILELADVVHPQAGANPLSDPRVRVHVEDGRYFLQMTPRRYDLITGEPPPPKNAGVVNLYTREYFSLIHDRLNDRGVVTYWLPVHSLLEPDAKAILGAFCDAFADCALWVGHGLDWMLTGSRGGLTAPPGLDFARQWRDVAVAPELRALGFERPEQLGATFLGDAAWLRERIADTAPLTDAWPKRLSDRPQRDAAGSFLGWLDETAAAERFRRSAYIRKIWPAELRGPTLASFELQRTINEIGRGQSIGWLRRLRDVHRLLSDPEFPELALWRLGITSDWVDAARSAQRADRPLAPHARVLGSRALVDGDFAGAARLFETARRPRPGEVGLLLLESYARCRAGDRDAASALLAHHARRLEGFRDSVAWLESTFSLEPPGAS
jgi:predicted membrane-bound spermidine synthase